MVPDFQLEDLDMFARAKPPRKWEKQALNAQDKVMGGYRKRGAVRNQREANKLHMFFSPIKVPKGLTNMEVRICLFLYDLQRKLRPPQRGGERILVSVLPGHLSKQRMTRSSFALGVAAFLENMPVSNTA
jgi:hypothetical protein